MSIGFVGSGKIAQALIKGLVTAGITKSNNIIASAPKDDVKSHQDTRALGCSTTYFNKEVVKNSEIVILAVKPHLIPRVLSEIREEISLKHLLISVALGISISSIENKLAEKTRVIRVMSNTPVLVRQGATVFACGSSALKTDAVTVKDLFSSVGICEEVPECLIDAVTALSGSGPAYIYMCMESLADAGVAQGIPRELSVKLVTQTVLGAARMAIETNKHFGALKDDVCSPAGCTIEAVYQLEKFGLRALLMDAVSVATKSAKSKTSKAKSD